MVAEPRQRQLHASVASRQQVVAAELVAEEELIGCGGPVVGGECLARDLVLEPCRSPPLLFVDRRIQPGRGALAGEQQERKERRGGGRCQPGRPEMRPDGEEQPAGAAGDAAVEVGERCGEVALDEAAKEDADAGARRGGEPEPAPRMERNDVGERGGGGEREWSEHERGEREQGNLEGITVASVGPPGAAAHLGSAAARGG